MLIRHLALAAIILCLSVNPLHGSGEREPWDLLEEGINVLDVEQVSYKLHVFVPDRDVDMDLLSKMVNCEADFAASFATRPEKAHWSAGRADEPGYMLIRVAGDVREECRLLWERLRQAVNCSDAECGFAWSVEGYISTGRSDDLAAIGRGLLDRLGAEVINTISHNGTFQILGHVSWFDQAVDLTEGKVNLDVELYYEPYRQQVRVRAGMPVFITSIYD